MDLRCHFELLRILTYPRQNSLERKENDCAFPLLCRGNLSYENQIIDYLPQRIALAYQD